MNRSAGARIAPARSAPRLRLVPQTSAEKKKPARKRRRRLTPEEKLHACLRAGVHRQRGSRAANAARHLRTRSVPPEVARALSQAGAVWWTREAARRAERPTLSLEERLRRHLVRRFCAEILRRGGEVSIDGRYGSTELEAVDRAGGLVLLRAEGWRQYSRRFGARRARLAYLCGRDDNGDFAARVAGTCMTVAEALEELTPAFVRRARASGRRVLRQGDVWIVELGPRARGDDFRALPDSHLWIAERRLLVHASADGRDHAPLHVPFLARAVPQSTLQMGRDGAAAWGAAD